MTQSLSRNCYLQKEVSTLNIEKQNISLTGAFCVVVVTLTEFIDNDKLHCFMYSHGGHTKSILTWKRDCLSYLASVTCFVSIHFNRHLLCVF